ncbi:cytosine permease [Nocardioides sp.]|uniref:purine-cytosine permease family protein n=1 Tax=Nocardioides sp. TaxID=35761 RepID=UPI00261CBF8C|nr:cytosine permease [Nocardioides sp.]MDI6910365.1 cytosine permease [Nocardioides sp.]
MSVREHPVTVPESRDAETAWPLLPGERTWRTRQLFVVLLVAASATWCYIIGEYVGYYLPLWPGALAMTAGAMIGMLLVTLAVVPASSRYGIDSIQAAVPQFGRNGWTLTVSLQYLSIIGWNSLLLIFFGKSFAEFLNAVGIGGSGIESWVVPIGTLVACAVVFVILVRGATGLERVSAVLFFFIVGVGVFLIAMLLIKQGGDLADAQPAYASAKRLDFQYGVEIGLVSLLSWWPYIGSMTRQAPSPRIAVMPSMLGMGLPVPVLSVVGLAGILVLETSDPAQWMTEVGGNFLGAIALLFVIAANFGTATAGIYASTVGLKSVPGLGRLSWNVALALSLVPVMVIGVVLPDWFFDHFGTFLAYIGVFFAPIVGIQIVDYFGLRRQNISLRAIYDRSPDAPYAYWFGLNPAAVVAMAAGVVTYLYLLNPQTYVIREPFSFLGASLPAALVAAVVHAVLTVTLIRRAGRGGYRTGAEADAQPVGPASVQPQP